MRGGDLRFDEGLQISAVESHWHINNEEHNAF